MTALTLVQVMEGLLDAIKAGLDTANPSGPTIARTLLTPGEVADDDCMCGQLTINEVQRYTSGDFPAPLVQGTTDNCGAPWLVVELKVTLARCVPTALDDSDPPSTVDLTAAAVQFSNDQGVIRKSAGCYLRPLFDSHQLASFDLGTQIPRGPTGGCIAGELQVFIGFTNGCGC